jgi:hypothetical protein
MRNSIRFPLLVVGLAVAPLSASADFKLPSTATHFKLLEPEPSLVTDERGNPQKAGPCGGSNTDWGTPSWAVTQVVGGQDLHLKIQETVYHPGHYRVALAVNSPTELPLDPVATTRDSDRGPWSVTGEIQDPPQIPVLADGLFPHSNFDADGRFVRPEGRLDPWEADIPLPNINCENCILQVVQHMNEHAFNNPGGYSYHKCAHLQITADPTKPLSTGWPAER